MVAADDDSLKCFMCEKTLGGWDANDDPMYASP